MGSTVSRTHFVEPSGPGRWGRRKFSSFNGAAVPTSVRNENTLPQIEATTGEIAVASAWSVFYLVMIVMAITG
jgi:hypothetical protein